MLTPRGRSVLAFAIGAAVAGRVLALRELAMAAAMLLAVLAAGLLTIRVRRPSLVASRRVSPQRTTVGGEIRVELAVANRGTVGGGPVLLEDVLPEGLSAPARLSLPSLGPRMERRIAYGLRPSRRGVFRIGPLDMMLTDPFGLFVRRQELPGSTSVVVYPEYERIRTVPRDVQRAGVVRRSALLGSGDEFYALRAYQEGDDLRKVHWPSSLKVGEPLIRQEELLQQPGLFIVLDSCAAKHQGEGASSSLEAAISACASVATLGVSSGMSVEVVTASGPLVSARRPNEDELLEALALLEPSGAHDMAAALVRSATRRPSYTALVVITPGLSDREVGMLAGAAQRAAGGIAVQIDAATFAGGTAAPRRPRAGAPLSRLGMPVLSLRAGESFHHTWEAGVRGVAVRR